MCEGLRRSRGKKDKERGRDEGKKRSETSAPLRLLCTSAQAAACTHTRACMRPRLHFPRALRRVLVVSKKTRLQVEMHSARLTDDGPELSSHLSRMGFDVSRLRSAHDSHVSSLDTILRELEARKIDVKLEFAKSLRAIPAEVDLVSARVASLPSSRLALATDVACARPKVITVGGDGTVLETAQFITSPRIPILGVNRCVSQPANQPAPTPG
jgi:hypothetical protein